MAIFSFWVRKFLFSSFAAMLCHQRSSNSKRRSTGGEFVTIRFLTFCINFINWNTLFRMVFFHFNAIMETRTTKKWRLHSREFKLKIAEWHINIGKNIVRTTLKHGIARKQALSWIKDEEKIQQQKFQNKNWKT